MSSPPPAKRKPIGLPKLKIESGSLLLSGSGDPGTPKTSVHGPGHLQHHHHHLQQHHNNNHHSHGQLSHASISLRTAPPEKMHNIPGNPHVFMSDNYPSNLNLAAASTSHLAATATSGLNTLGGSGSGNNARPIAASGLKSFVPGSTGSESLGGSQSRLSDKTESTGLRAGQQYGRDGDDFGENDMDSSSSSSSSNRAIASGFSVTIDPTSLSVPKSPAVDRRHPQALPPTMITSDLYLGTETNAQSLPLMKSLGITHILIVAKECKFWLGAESNVQHKSFPISDHFEEDILMYFADCFDFLDEVKKANGIALVHCSYGISRSPTIVIGYLMKKNVWTLRDAYDYVKTRRPIVCPNVGFICQLTEFERTIVDVSEALRREEISQQILANAAEIVAAATAKTYQLQERDSSQPAADANHEQQQQQQQQEGSDFISHDEEKGRDRSHSGQGAASKSSSSLASTAEVSSDQDSKRFGTGERNRHIGGSNNNNGGEQNSKGSALGGGSAANRSNRSITMLSNNAVVSASSSVQQVASGAASVGGNDAPSMSLISQRPHRHLMGSAPLSRPRSRRLESFKARRPSSAVTIPLVSLKILLVEEHTLEPSKISQSLSSLGHECDSVANEAEATDLLSRKKYDLVLMDVSAQARDPNGTTVLLQRMEDLGLTAGVPLITIAEDTVSLIPETLGRPAGIAKALGKEAVDGNLAGSSTDMLRSRETLVPSAVGDEHSDETRRSAVESNISKISLA